MVICGINKRNMHKTYGYKETQVQLHKMKKIEMRIWDTNTEKIPNLNKSEAKLRPSLQDAG